MQRTHKRMTGKPNRRGRINRERLTGTRRRTQPLQLLNLGRLKHRPTALILDRLTERPRNLSLNRTGTSLMPPKNRRPQNRLNRAPLRVILSKIGQARGHQDRHSLGILNHGLSHRLRQITSETLNVARVNEVTHAAPFPSNQKTRIQLPCCSSTTANASTSKMATYSTASARYATWLRR